MMNQPDRNHHVNPRYRAYGRARLEIAQRARTRQDWDALWKRPQYSFPFVWGRHWRQCIEYRVDDFAAEVGFLIDVLGLPINAFNTSYAMFTSPDNEFYFAIVPATLESPATPPDAIRIQFMVDDIFATTTELERRGIAFDSSPQPVAEGSLQWVVSFNTPHGICMELWGMVEQDEELDELDASGEAVEPALDLELPLTELVASEQLESKEEDYSAEPLNHRKTPPWQSRPVVEPEYAPEDGDGFDDEEQDEQVVTAETERARRPAPERPERVFTNGQEMLAHLQRQGKLSTMINQTPSPGTSPVPSFAFRPAPKPQQAEPKPSLDPSPDVADSDELPQESYHYKPITFRDEAS